MRPCSALLPLSAAFVAFTAMAQSSAPQADAAAAGPGQLSYRSALGAYQRLTDEKVISWTEANDTVGRVGGWREYAREAAQPAAMGATPAASAPRSSAPAAAPPAPSAPAAGGHHQH